MAMKWIINDDSILLEEFLSVNGKGHVTRISAKRNVDTQGQGMAWKRNSDELTYHHSMHLPMPMGPMWISYLSSEQPWLSVHKLSAERGATTSGFS